MDCFGSPTKTKVAGTPGTVMKSRRKMLYCRLSVSWNSSIRTASNRPRTTAAKSSFARAASIDVSMSSNPSIPASCFNPAKRFGASAIKRLSAACRAICVASSSSVVPFFFLAGTTSDFNRRSDAFCVGSTASFLKIVSHSPANKRRFTSSDSAARTSRRRNSSTVCFNHGVVSPGVTSKLPP